MRTVKEISNLTGISVRTLHYYDEIGLLRPTIKSEAGYRLYDDKALETLQQILFFREFDIPLKEIKAVVNSPALDRNRILKMQKTMLTAKMERLKRLVASIDDILKGENNMDFEVFNKSDIEQLCQASIEHMPDFMRDCIVKEFGGIEQWKAHYIERASKEDMQKGYQKMVGWYGGDKERALNVMVNPPDLEVCRACGERINEITARLVEKRNRTAEAAWIRELIGEYGTVMKELYQIEDETELMRQVASSYHDERQKAATDEKFGEGTADYLAEVIEEVYGEE